MEFIKLTPENLEKEHICCAISNNNDPQVASKKAWLFDRMTEGLVFLRADTRGKCFIEYLPAEYAWVPVKADGYMFINCFWVAGSLKGNGYATELLDACIKDSREKGKKGLCVISSKKKKSFLSDPKFLLYKGFVPVDTAEPDYILYALPFGEEGEKPQFFPSAKNPTVTEKGLVLYYTDQCPFNAKYVPLLEAVAKEKGVAFHTVHVSSRTEAQAVPCAVTTYALFRDGEYLGNEMQSEKKFAALCDEYKASSKQ